MKFQLVAGVLVNIDWVESFSPTTDKESISKTFDEKQEIVVTRIQGEPYKILCRMGSGQTLVMGYKEESDRDMKFRSLTDALTSR